MLDLIMKIVGIILDQVAAGAISLEEAKARARESIAKAIDRAALSDAETAALDAEIDALIHGKAGMKAPAPTKTHAAFDTSDEQEPDPK
jgi:hypothetical protein